MINHLFVTALEALVKAAVGGAFAAVIAAHPIRKHLRNQARIRDELDTSTPGGLTDVVAALKGHDDA